MTRLQSNRKKNLFISITSLKMLFVLSGLVLVGNLAVAFGNDAVSLYSSHDQVVELVDANITNSIYNSRYLWVVEFYAHWCGHCQRFAPTWMQLAEEFSEWSDYVKISALNCAEQDKCSDFGIAGTPTVRVFPPRTAHLLQGIDIDLHERSDSYYLGSSVMYHLAQSQKSRLFSKPLPNLQYASPLSFLELYSSIKQTSNRLTVFVVESADVPRLGLLVLQALGPNNLRHLNLRRVPASAQHVFQEYYTQLDHFPAVILDFGTLNQGYTMDSTIFMPNELSHVPMVDQVLGFLQPYLPQRNPPHIVASTLASTTLPSPIAEVNNEDIVYATDLEKAVEYAITEEIASQPILTQDHLSTLYMFLDVIVRYLPIRTEIKDFVAILRDWPSRAQLTSITNKEYEAKVVELQRLYRPFRGTPEKWTGCQGSSPKYRGYPCSLWTLFHTLTVNAAIRDQDKEIYEGLSLVWKAMISYIHYFFSCRHCAENFATKVRDIGIEPSTPRETILWLWQIHNMGNKKLAGDLTEDPAHPKIEWPSPAHCPECRAMPRQNTGVRIDGTLWNLDKTADYLIKVYREENIIPNAFNTSGLLREERISMVKELLSELVSDYNSSQTSNNITVGELLEKINIEQFCQNVYNNVE